MAGQPPIGHHRTAANRSQHPRHKRIRSGGMHAAVGILRCFDSRRKPCIHPTPLPAGRQNHSVRLEEIKVGERPLRKCPFHSGSEARSVAPDKERRHHMGSRTAKLSALHPRARHQKIHTAPDTLILRKREFNTKKGGCAVNLIITTQPPVISFRRSYYSARTSISAAAPKSCPFCELSPQTRTNCPLTGFPKLITLRFLLLSKVPFATGSPHSFPSVETKIS